MKRKILMIFFIFINFSIFSQTNVCVDIDDEVYSILNIAEVQGLCTPLLNVKPYTQKYILKKIEEIKNNIYKSEYQTNVMSSEVEYIENYIKKFENKLNYSSKTLTSISEILGIVNPQAHRALADSITTAKVYLKLLEIEERNK